MYKNFSIHTGYPLQYNVFKICLVLKIFAVNIFNDK